ncbi:MAG TPA: MFS transporter, partial [Candidatus Thermoplasmatota archaeon]|nr:MFS transporter [Candidatus Thermoplasmatota archaeon]
FRRLLLFLGAWGFAMNFSLPFITVVLLKTLQFSLWHVTLLAALSQVGNLLGFRLWAPLTDRFGNKPVLLLAASSVTITLALWAILPQTVSPFTGPAIVALHAYLGFALAGLDLAANGIVLKLSEEGAEAPYLATASVVKALGTGVAPLVGGLVATLLAPARFTVSLAAEYDGHGTGLTAFQIAHYDFLFLISFLVALYALHRLLAFEEPGEAHPHAVVRAMRREIPQISSVAGLRVFAHAASYLVETAYLLERKVGRPLGSAGPRADPPDSPR